MAEIFQDTITIIGEVKKLDSLRVSKTGYEMFYLVLTVPNPKAGKPVYLPCTVYGKKASEFEKTVQKQDIKIGDLVDVQGSHINIYRDGKPSLEITIHSIEKYHQ